VEAHEKQRPGHQLQVDVKFIEPLGQTGRRKKHYQLTAIDDCTRLRVLRAYPRCDQKTAIAFIDHVLSKLPFAVERVQTDIQAWWCPEGPWICPAGGVRIEGSGTRASSSLDRVERDATPCLLIMLVCGAFRRRPATADPCLRMSGAARLMRQWAVDGSESVIWWELAVQLRLGIDIASSRSPSQPRRRAGPVHLDRTSVPHHAAGSGPAVVHVPDGTDPAEVCRRTVVSAVGEQRVYAPPRRGFRPRISRRLRSAASLAVWPPAR
jgi:hypothetical protein